MRGFYETAALQTPKSPIGSRVNITPSRLKMQERVSSSPLRVPLERAIERCAQEKSISRSRTPTQSQRDSSVRSVLKRTWIDDESSKTPHPETTDFLRKHFRNVSVLSLNQLLSKIVQEYDSLWGNQSIDNVMTDLGDKLAQIFGGQQVTVPRLINLTSEDGMVGLILRAFREIKSESTAVSRVTSRISFHDPRSTMSISKSFEERLFDNHNAQNIKNIVQEFMESMYQCMESEIYERFNVEMKRMVLKHREADRVLRRVNEQITNYADVFDAQKALKAKDKIHKQALAESNAKISRLEEDNSRLNQTVRDLRSDKQRLIEEIDRLKDTLEKMQSALINRALQAPASRSGNPLADRTNQAHNMPRMSESNISKEPFQIKIDTQIIHRDGPDVGGRNYGLGHGGLGMSQINTSIGPSPIQTASYMNSSTFNNPSQIPITLSPIQRREEGSFSNLTSAPCTYSRIIR